MKAVFALVWLLATLPVFAQTPAAPLAEVQRDHTTIRLYSETANPKPGVPFWVALEFVPEDGWHTYWLNPGDSGMSTHVGWQGADAGNLQFPTPEPLPVGPLLNYGYEGRSVLLHQITLPEASDGEVTVFAEWLVCDDVCIPEIADLRLRWPLGDGAADPGLRSFFAQARAAMPQPSVWPVSAVASKTHLYVTVYADPAEAGGVQRASFYPENGALIAHAARQEVGLTEEGFRLAIPLQGMPVVEEQVAGILRLEYLDGRVEGWSVQTDVTIMPGDMATMTATGSETSSEIAADGGRPMSQISLVSALGLALLGGLILNLMPCVFPVLSLKALSLVKARGRDRSHARVEGLAYAAGVILSFLIVGGALLAFRGAGHAVGWGFQLQSPWVITALALLLFTVGLNLAGWFDISSRFTGIGQSLASSGGLKGAFFTGVLATVVATPCTAPAMAPALGFALTQPPIAALAIFVALGLGLAAPVLAISFSPVLQKLLPRPGVWMDVFKQALSFPIFLTVIWLVYVLAAQTGPTGTVMVLAGMVIIAFAIWLSRIWGGSLIWRGAGVAVLLALLGGWVGGANRFLVSQPMILASADQGGAQSRQIFDPVAFKAVEQGSDPAFVYFTAAWCITCKANEVALADASVKSFLQENAVQVMVGDWTNRNAEILAVLQKYDRSGVPLYLFFPGDAPPVLLPEFPLTPSLVTSIMKDALERS